VINFDKARRQKHGVKVIRNKIG